ncbi:MAG: hypothetical protein PHI27_12835 [Eubacteriales bacterium]|nr:hypothetical protein [Eubacteriales bacterium]MDD3883107.1 hypothetical protein [Eubacteriales bacterium]MDD4513323.1 hypothetical protein [Eubacteriales bacterium]
MSILRKVVSLLLIIAIAALPSFAFAEGGAKEISLALSVDAPDESIMNETDKAVFTLLSDIFDKLEMKLYYSPEFFSSKVIFDGQEEFRLENVLDNGMWYEYSPQMSNIAFTQYGYKTTDFPAALKPYIDAFSEWFAGETTVTNERTISGGKLADLRVSRAALSDVSAYGIIRKLADMLIADDNLIHDVTLYISGINPVYYENGEARTVDESLIREIIDGAVKSLETNLGEENDKLSVNIAYDENGAVRSFDLFLVGENGEIKDTGSAFYSAENGEHCLIIWDSLSPYITAKWRTNGANSTGSIVINDYVEQKIEFTAIDYGADNFNLIVRIAGDVGLEYGFSIVGVGNETRYSGYIAAAGARIGAEVKVIDAEIIMPNIALDGFDKLFFINSINASVAGNINASIHGNVPIALPEGHQAITEDDLREILARMMPISFDILSHLSDEAMAAFLQLSQNNVVEVY